MESLDRLEWAAGVSLTAHGTRIGIRATRPEPLAALVGALPPVWRPTASPVVDRLYSVVVPPPAARRGVRHYYLLYADAARIARSAGFQEVCVSLAGHAQLHLARSAPRLLFVHAGVVLWRARALLLPGASRSGKSTLVAALVRAGAAYFSDEYAILDPVGRVRPYRAAISLRPDVAAGFSDVLGGCQPRGRSAPAAPVAAIAFVRHESGGRLSLRRLSAGETTLGLVANTVAARDRPAAALAAAGCLSLAAGLRLRGVRGEAAVAAGRLLQELETICR